MSIKVSNQIIQNFAKEGRTIVSRWRCRYFLWIAGEPFADEARALRIIRTMERMDWVKPLEGGKQQLFRITAPFAPEAPNPYEAALEGYHGCTLAYGTALELHQLTDQRDTTIHLLSPSGRV